MVFPLIKIKTFQSKFPIIYLLPGTQCVNTRNNTQFLIRNLLFAHICDKCYLYVRIGRVGLLQQIINPKSRVAPWVLSRYVKVAPSN